MERIEIELTGRPGAPLVVEVLPTAYSPICIVKRAVSAALPGAPSCASIRITNKHKEQADSVYIKRSFIASVRSRRPTIDITVQPYNGPSYKVKVDLQTDTILDVRFLLAAVTGIPAECHFLSRNGCGQSALPDSALLSSVPNINTSGLRVWFEIPQTEPGRGRAHRTVPAVIACSEPAQNTMQSLLRASFDRFAKKPFLGTRSFLKDGSRGPYTWLSFSEVSKRVSNFGSGLRKMGLAKGSSVGIMADNRTEWAITDFMCMCYGFVSVTLYETLGPDVIKYIINHAEVAAVVFSKSKTKDLVAAQPHCPKLLYSILMDDQSVDTEYCKVETKGYTHRMSAIERIGAEFPSADILAGPNTVASICYTSGTTGNPKGAMLSHGNLLSGTVAINMHVMNSQDPPPFELNETTISYLPLAHIYERIAHLSALSRGVGIGYFAGDTTKLLEDVALLKPTFFPGVPRVWQRVHDNINQQVANSGWLTRSLFRMAYDSKVAALRDGNDQATLWDSLVFRKIADKFGGNLQLMVSGSAPINSQIATFMRICFKAAFVEGYGLTETCALATLSPLGDLQYGHVGVPVACSEIMLVDVPEMNYLSTDQPCSRGEVWIRGPHVFLGYYKQEETTRESITEDGWFKTGDIGQWRSDGRLEIIDRKKNIFKLSQGEYIRPEYIESVYKQSTYIANVFVYGDSLQQYLVAIIVPNAEMISKWSAYAGRAPMSIEKMIEEKSVQKLVKDELFRVGGKEGLRGFEQVRKFRLIGEDFSIANDLLTPSLKLKRHEAKIRFERLISEMYNEQTAPQAKL